MWPPAWITRGGGGARDVLTRVLLGGGGGRREAQRNVTLLTVETVEGPQAMEGRRPLEGERARNRCSPRVSGRNGSVPCLHLGVSPEKGPDPPELGDSGVWVVPTILVSCHNSHRKHIQVHMQTLHWVIYTQNPVLGPLLTPALHC